MGSTKARALANAVATLDLADILEEVFDDVSEQIIDLQKEQLRSGVDAKGLPMPKYAEETIKAKEEKGIIVEHGRYTLFEDGDFYSGIFSSNGMGILELSSTDYKTEMLIEEYGKDIFGFNNDSIEKLKEIVVPLVKKKITLKLKI